MLKTCTKCGSEQPVEHFHRRRLRGPDGRVAVCKTCSKGVAAAYYQANKETVLLRHKTYRDENSEKCLEINRAYRKQDPERQRRVAARRRRLVAEARSRPEGEQVRKKLVFERDMGRCYLCLTVVDYRASTIDHVVPLSRDGDHNYTNVRIACVACNMSKGSKLVEELSATEWPNLRLPLEPVSTPVGTPYNDPNPLSGEEWRPMSPWNGRYEVSNYGRVRSKTNQRFHGLRILKPKITKMGYAQYGLPTLKDNGPRTQWFPVHKLVLEAFVGPRPSPDHVARHLDDDGLNNHVSNLA